MPDIDATVGGDESNSYLDADVAADRADERIGSATWLDLSDDDQARSLITATRAIDSLDLIGIPTDEDQALHFPIDGADVIPSKIQQATLELAISYAPYLKTVAAGGDASDPLSATPSNIKREKVDVLETEYFAPSAAMSDTGLASFPLPVQRLLADYVRTPAASISQWGTGIAVRAS